MFSAFPAGIYATPATASENSALAHAHSMALSDYRRQNSGFKEHMTCNGGGMIMNGNNKVSYLFAS